MGQGYLGARMSTAVESLSFTVRPVISHGDLVRACRVRALAYGAKSPHLRESMLEPDSVDALPTTTTYLCEDKFSGQAMGTMRVQVSGPQLSPLSIDGVVPPLREFQTAYRAEITRLAAPVGADPFVRLALWKAGFMHCRSHHVRLLMLAVRKPALIKAYTKMGAKDVCGELPIPYAGNLPHRVMGLFLDDIESEWRMAQHPLLKFMVETAHPDIAQWEPKSMNAGAAVAAQARVVGILERAGKFV